MANLKSQEQQMRGIKEAIRIEVQAQLRAQVKGLERRVALLEAQLDTDAAPPSLFSNLPNRQCCDLSGVHKSSPAGHGYLSFTQVLRSSPNESMTMQSKEVSREAEEEETIVEEKLPESMYNYCMKRLAVSPNPLLDPALSWWVLLFVVQFVTMAAFVVCNDLTNNAIGAVPVEKREGSVVSCMLAESYIFGIPGMKYGIGYVAIFLVASVMRNDDLDSLKAEIPHQENSMAIRVIGSFAWFWQTVYMPGCFGLEAATMFASSSDPLEVVTNTLAVTFIMEIDNMIYRNCLPEHDKTFYRQLARMSVDGSRNTEKSSWALFALNMVTMVILFTKISVTYGQDKLHGDAYLNDYWMFTSPLYLAIYAGRFLLGSIFDGSTETRHCPSFKDFRGTALAGLFGVLVYCFSRNLATFSLLEPPFWHWEASAYIACVDAEIEVLSSKDF